MFSFKFIISGKVQGVYYRKSVQENALKAKFSGYVKNLNDGTVEAAVTCEESKLKDFISILEKGSFYSKVTSITKYSSDKTFSGDFKVIY